VEAKGELCTLQRWCVEDTVRHHPVVEEEKEVTREGPSHMNVLLRHVPTIATKAEVSSASAVSRHER
jgi:hypothetical protein